MKTLKEFSWNVNYYYNNTTNSDCIGHFFAYDVMTFPEKCEMSKERMQLLINIAEEKNDNTAMIMFLTEFVAS
jgi:formate/nitrite transporter FocA (FNT family)